MKSLRRGRRSRRTRRVFKLGDKVEVQVAKVDTFKRQVDFKLAAAASQPRRTGIPRSERPRPDAKRWEHRTRHRKRQPT